MKFEADIKKSDREFFWYVLVLLAIGTGLSLISGLIVILGFLILALLSIIGFVIEKTVRNLSFDADKHALVAITKNRLSAQETRYFLFAGLSYSYKKEAMGRGSSGKRLRIYCENRCVLKLDRKEPGWDEEQIDNIVRELDKNTIPRKHIGYSLKNVFPNDFPLN